jgi:hypothetical protein
VVDLFEDCDLFANPDRLSPLKGSALTDDLLVLVHHLAAIASCARLPAESHKLLLLWVAVDNLDSLDLI